MGELDLLARKYGTDKRTNDPGQIIYHGYTPIYEELFSPIRYNAINLLEIGIREGWSHFMWHEYFPNGIIYGIDNFSDIAYHLRQISPEDILSLEKDRLKFFIGDASDHKILNKYFKQINFDIIIDDGSHKTIEQFNSFKYLFNLIKPNGFYFIEDLNPEQQRRFKDYFGGYTMGELGIIKKY